MKLGTGIHCVSAKDYHADCCESPSLSSSLAVELITRSPAHARFKHPRLNPDYVESEATETMAFGSVVHELLLSRGTGFAVWNEETWRGNDAKLFKAEAIAEGKTPIKIKDFETAQTIARSAIAQIYKMNLGYVLEEGVSEATALWKDRGHYMRAMFDRWLPERGEIWDIKTTGKSAHPEQIAKTITNMNYDLRSEFYLMGAEKLTGLPSAHSLGFIFLFIETEPPFSVVPCFMDSALKARGKMRANQAIETWARCMDSGVWPSYVNGITEIAAPGWVDYETEESILESNGAKVL